MNCQEIERVLEEKALAELAGDERTRVDAHLAECRACREAWDPAFQSQVLREAVKELRGAASVKDSVMARVRGETTRPAGAPSGDEPALPARIGGFEILGTLGRGGMGMVLKARQVSMDRIVALKILPHRLAQDEAFVTRFIREAHAAAKLRHPHIVQGYDAGLADGYYYFAMEYVDGKGLDAVLAREGPLESRQALRILKQAASALWAAHEAGIVHRDIKPSNLMLDSRGDVRVTDFGLAKLTDATLAPERAALAPGAPPAPNDVTATTQGQALGTPAYLAPEVAKGDPADARSDLYSLGATFYHVLAGRPPLEGHNLTEMLTKQIHEQPPPLSEAAPHVAAGLCTLIDRLLGKDPEARPESARDLLDLLEALGPLGSADGGTTTRFRGMDTPAVPPTLPPKGGRRWNRQQRTAVLAAAGLLALASVVFLASRRGRPAEREKASAQTPAPDRITFDEAREREARALFDRARAAADRFQWEEALRDLETLGRKHGDSRVWPERTGEIARLRDEVETGLRRRAARAKAEAAPGLPPVAAPPRVAAARGEGVALVDPKTPEGRRALKEGGLANRGPVRVEEGGIVTVKPVETDELLANPGIGWETFHRTTTQDEHLPNWIPSTVQYARWGWRTFEPQPGKIDYGFLDNELRGSRQAGQQLAFRVMCCSDDPGYSCHPAWLTEVGGRILDVQYRDGPVIRIPDLDDPEILGRHLDLIRRLGERYDGHPDIDHIDIGSVGWWGGWYMGNTKGASMPTPETQKKIADAYLAAFKRTPLLSLISGGPMLTYAARRGAGWRADCPGEMGGFPETWRDLRRGYPLWIQEASVREAWRRAPVAWQSWPDMRHWVHEGWPLRFIFNYALARHGSLLCNRSDPLPEGEEVRAEITRFLRRLGYRLVLRELAHAVVAAAGRPFELSMKWQNVGSAPCYRPYRVAYRLVGPDGQSRVFVGGVAVNQWLPGSVPLFTQELNNGEWDLPNGEVAEVKDEIPLPANLPAGRYGLSVAVVSGDPPAPAIRLGIHGRDADGWYPLSTLEVRK